MVDAKQRDNTVHYVFLTGFSLLLFSHTLCADSLSTQIDKAINKELPYASVSILVKEAKNSHIIYSNNANKLLSPASTIKLFTAAAALYHWNINHRFETQLLKQKSNYYIRFGGSPSLTSDNLSALLIDYLKENNIKQIKGSIILDTSRFKPPYYPNGVSYDDMGWYYAAPTTSIMLNKNTSNYILTPSSQLGTLATINPQKTDKSLIIINEVITVSKEEEKQHCALNIEIKPQNTLRLYGCVAQSNSSKILELAIPDPELYAKQTIEDALKKNNIQLNGLIVNGTIPKDALRLATFQSDSLEQLVTHMLQESDNLYADTLSKQLAYSLTQEGTNKQALFALKTILAKNTKLDMTQLELADGVGTRYNLANAEQISLLLSTIYRDKKLFPILFKALPQSGVSGTLKDRMNKSPLAKIVHAKTGSMHDISSLSGYLINPHGKPIIFSIIINGINQPSMRAKLLEEEILTIIDKEINRDSPEHSEFA